MILMMMKQNARPLLRNAPRRFSSFKSNHYGLSSEQLQLVDLCEGFAENEFKPFAADWDEKKIFPKQALRNAANIGLGGMFVKEDLGGSAFSRHDGSLIFEALSKGCTSTTAYLSIHNMCAWMISEFGTPQQHQRYLPDLLTMTSFASYCLTEPNSGSDAGSLRTSAVESGEYFILNGTKAFISGGSTSNVYVVMARSEQGTQGARGITCFLVDGDNPGISFGAQERKLGWNSQPTCMVHFDQCLVKKQDSVLGKRGEGFKIAMQGLDGGRLSIGACSVGAAQASFDFCLQHTKDRKQFGHSLSENQTVQFTLAEMQTKVHLSRLAIRNAANLLDLKDASATAHCSMAKKVSTDYCFQVVDQALQLLGGYGYLKDYPIERLLRDSRVHRILEGTNEVQSMIMARELLK